MRFDPSDNLFGEPWPVWVATAAIWFGVIWLFNGLPEPLTREYWRRERRHRAARQNERKPSPPSETGA